MYEDLLPHTLPTESERLDQMGRAHDPDARAAIRRLNLPSHAHCIDIGTGRGTMAIWLAETFPDGPAPTSAVVAGDGRAALVETDEGPALIWAMGQDCAARLLAAADVTPTKKGLRVDFHDFGTPPVHVALDGARDADAWRAILTETAAETSNA